MDCIHEFDFSRQLLSSPPQVRCTHCHKLMFVDDARQYVRRQKLSEGIAESMKEHIAKQALVEAGSSVWLKTVFECLRNGHNPTDAYSVADRVTKEYATRFLENK